MASSDLPSTAQNLQQLLKNVSQAKKVHDSRSARNKRENFFDDRIACSQRSKSAANWQSRKSDLVSLLQCTAPGSIGCTVQRQQYNWSASNMSQQIQQTAPQSSSVQHRFSVKSIGESLNITYQGSTHLESVPFSPSSHSNVSFFNAPMIRGLSPQWKSNKLNHLIDAKQEGNCIDRNCLQQNASKSSANDVDSKFSTMLSCAQARVLPVKRNLEAELNVDQTDGSTSKRKVRMGWSPHKRKLSNEKDQVLPPVLVISSDEEDSDNTRKEKNLISSARIGMLKPKKDVKVSSTALNIALQLPLASGITDGGSGHSKPVDHLESSPLLDHLNYGLSILDEPQKILDALEEVLRERPKRLRVSLRSLYTYSKLGCLSKVLSILLENLNPAAGVHSEDGKSALHAAASKGHLDILVILVYKAAGNIDVMDKYRRTPLFIAVEKGHLKAAQFLYKAGASLACKNFDGMGLTHVAAHKGHVRILKWLLSHQRDLCEQDNGGWTSLMWAAEDGNSEALKLLVKKGAKTDTRDNELNTVLHWASMAGALEGCEVLLNAKCNLNSINMYGDTPLHIAAREGNADVVKLFLLRGADTSIRNKEGKMPMDVCVNNPTIRDTIRLRHAIGHVTVKRHYDCDISKGKERIPVSCINEVDDEPLPLNFTYITEPIESSTVSILKDLMSIKGCKCQNDCAVENCECIQKNEESRCWFDEGILDVRFLDLDQPVLFECSRLCRCWSHCSNRVVQKGISFRLEVFKTSNIGWGLRTICPIPMGAFVLSYVGEVIADDEADRRADDSYLFDLDMKNSKEDDNCLDANHYGNCGRFINHSCESNLMPVRVFTHHRDWRFPGIAFFASRDIDAYEALSFDYGDRFWEIKRKSGLRCLCNSDSCKYNRRF